MTRVEVYDRGGTAARNKELSSILHAAWYLSTVFHLRSDAVCNFFPIGE